MLVFVQCCDILPLNFHISLSTVTAGQQPLGRAILLMLIFGHCAKKGAVFSESRAHEIRMIAHRIRNGSMYQHGGLKIWDLSISDLTKAHKWRFRGISAQWQNRASNLGIHWRWRQCICSNCSPFPKMP